MRPSAHSVFLGGSLFAVALAVAAGLFLLGSPAEERARRLDDRRVADLEEIMAGTDLYWTRNERLPASLDELTREPGVQIPRADPGTGEAYEYRPADSARYEVCARFDAASRAVARTPEGDLWTHAPGRQCFRLEATRIERDGH